MIHIAQIALARTAIPLRVIARSESQSGTSVLRRPTPAFTAATATRPACPCGSGYLRCQETPVAAEIRPPGGGVPLSAGVRRLFEPRFGSDLSGVRIHTGGTADSLACTVATRAFTIGSPLLFGRDQYAPEQEAEQPADIREPSAVTSHRAGVAQSMRLGVRREFWLKVGKKAQLETKLVEHEQLQHARWSEGGLSSRGLRLDSAVETKSNHLSVVLCALLQLRVTSSDCRIEALLPCSTTSTTPFNNF